MGEERCGTDSFSGDFFRDYCKYPEKVNCWDPSGRKRFGRVVVSVPGFENPMVSHFGCFCSHICSGERNARHGEGRRRLLMMSGDKVVRKLLDGGMRYFSVREMEHYFGMTEVQDFVICRICGKKLKYVTTGHLRSRLCREQQRRMDIDGITYEEYGEKYPMAPVMSLRCRRNHRDGLKDRKMPEGWALNISRALTEYLSGLSEEELSERSWNRGLTKETDERVKKNAEAISNYWKSMSDEDVEIQLMKMFRGLQKRPTNPERMLDSILKLRGFIYTGDGRVMISRRNPDFVHNSKKLIIEYDGWIGHDPDSPYTSKDVIDYDNRRDKIYREAGYDVLRILPGDIKEGEDFVRYKVDEWFSEVIRRVDA